MTIALASKVETGTETLKLNESAPRVGSHTLSETWDYGQFFIGMVTVGSVDALKNFKFLWPCVGDVSNLALTAFNSYKYIDQYIKTENAWLMTTVVARGLTGT